MAFATSDDIASRLGRSLATAEAAPVALLLASATALIADAVGKDDTWAAALSPVPGVVKATCVEMVTRALANPQSLVSTQEALGAHNFSVRFGPGIYLTETEERIIRRCVYGSGVVGVRVPTMMNQVERDWDGEIVIDDDIIADDVS